MVLSKVRMFGGKQYRLYMQANYADDARAAAEGARERGLLTRIVKNRGHVGGPKYPRYSIFTRKE